MRAFIILFTFFSAFFVSSAFPNEIDDNVNLCMNGDSKSCLLATDYLLDKINIGEVSNNEEQILNLLFKSCKLGEACSCERVANLYYSGEFVNIDLKKVLEAEELGCKLNNTQSCVNIAEEYSKGINRKKDHLKAYKYYTKSCDLNHGESCNIAAIYNNTLTGFKDFPKGFSNHKLAAKFYRRGCKLKSAYSCRNLAVSYLLGYGVKVSRESAIANYKLAIKYGYTSGVDKKVQLQDLGFTINLDD